MTSADDGMLPLSTLNPSIIIIHTTGTDAIISYSVPHVSLPIITYHCITRYVSAAVQCLSHRGLTNPFLLLDQDPLAVRREPPECAYMIHPAPAEGCI